MKFKYYIVDMIAGEMKGTDSDDVAKELAESEDFFVVEAETAKWILPDGETKDVEEFKVS